MKKKSAFRRILCLALFVGIALSLVFSAQSVFATATAEVNVVASGCGSVVGIANLPEHDPDSISYEAHGNVLTVRDTGGYEMIYTATPEPGSKFVEWATVNPGFADVTLIDDFEQYLVSKVATVKAVFTSEVADQPAADNDFTVGLDSTYDGDGTVSYAWYAFDLDDKTTFTDDCVDYYDANCVCGAMTAVKIESTVPNVLMGNCGSVANIRFIYDADLAAKYFAFTCESALKGYTFHAGDWYVYKIQTVAGVSPALEVRISCEDESFTLSDPCFLNEATAVSGETTAHLGFDGNDKATSLKVGNALYYCKVFRSGALLTTSNAVKPCEVSFEGGEGATGTAPDTIYGLAGREIVLPTGTFTKTDYNLYGWMYGTDDYTFGEKFTPTEDVVMTAAFSHNCHDHVFKKPLTLTEGELHFGDYYLTEDLTLTGDLYAFTYSTNDTVTLCLNGHILNLNGYHLSCTDNFFIYDCDDDESNVRYFKKQGNLYVLSDENDYDKTVTGGVITGGACPSSSAVPNGGAVHANVVHATGVAFVGNSAYDTDYGVNLDGGAIYAEKYVRAVDCVFLGNVGNSGGAIRVANDTGGAIRVANDTGELNVYNCSFIENYAHNDGGALNADGRILVADSEIAYNTAMATGGAVAAGSGILTVRGSNIHDNTAAVSGGGVKFENANCLVEGTKILMGDGVTTKNIEDIRLGDEVLSFNHETGKYESNEVYIAYKGYSDTYFTLIFESGATLSISGCHDLFEENSMSYFTVSSSNAVDCVGKSFYNSAIGDFDEVVQMEFGYGLVHYSIYVKKTFNCIANGLLTVPDDVDFALNIYTFGADLKADATALAADIATYGLYNYEDLPVSLTEEEFEFCGLKYYNIFIGKGFVTREQLLNNFYEWHDANEFVAGVSGPALILGDDVVIQNNKVGEKQDNVNLSKGTDLIVLDGATGINVGITAVSRGVFAEDVYTNDKTKVKFTSDDARYAVAVATGYDYYLTVVFSQPSKDNDYTVVLTDTYAKDENTKYQWFKKGTHYDYADITEDDFSITVGSSDGNDVTSTYQNVEGTDYDLIRISCLRDAAFFTFSCSDGDLYVMDGCDAKIVSHEDDLYTVYAPSGVLYLYAYGEFTLTDVEIDTVRLLSGEVNAKLGNSTLSAGDYYCVIFYDNGSLSLLGQSDTVSPKAVAFSVGAGVVGQLPTTVYQLEGRKVTLPTVVCKKQEYFFGGWKNGNAASDAGTQYTVLSADVTFDAVWKPVAVAQPTKSNDYTFELDSKVTGATYTWYALSKTAVTPQSGDIIGTSGTMNGNTVSTDADTISFSFNSSLLNQGTFLVQVTSEKELSGYLYRDGNLYLYRVNVTVGMHGLSMSASIRCTESGFSVSNVAFVPTTELSDETAAKLGSTALTDKRYLCVVNGTVGSEEVTAASVPVTPIAVSFAGISGATGTAPDTVYQLDGRTVTLPANPFTVVNYYFSGWSDGTATSAAGAKVTVGAVGIAFTASFSPKTAVLLTETAQSFTYSGAAKAFALLGTHKDIGDFTVTYFVSGAWTASAPVNAGTYDVKLVRAEDATYASYEKTVTGGVVIGKLAVAEPSVSGTYTYTGTAIVPSVSGKETYMTESGDVSATNAGNYTITYTLDDNHAWATGSDGVVAWAIDKAVYDMSGVTFPNGTFKEDGTAHTLTIVGTLPAGVTVSYAGGEKTAPGKYTVTASFTGDDNHEAIAPMAAVLTVNAPTISGKTEGSEKNEVIAETDNGFGTEITVVVEVTVESAVVEKIGTNEMAADYYHLEDEQVKLRENETVGIVYDVKLIRTVDGVATAIQPSDIAPGTKIKVKMLIPADVDVSRVTRILHVHTAGDIEVIDFDASKIDAEGYYEIEIDRLSEFAFLYEKESADACTAHWFYLALTAAIVGFAALLRFALGIRAFRENGKVNLFPVVGFAVEAILTASHLFFAHCALCYAVMAVNAVLVILSVLLYLGIFGGNKKEGQNAPQPRADGLALKDAMALAKNTKATSVVSKKSIADFLKNKFGEGVVLNCRPNYITSGILPLADTHYKVAGETKKCVFYVYELKDGNVLLLVRADEKTANEIRKKHPAVVRSAYPKAKDADWYTVVLDDSFSPADVFDTVALVFEKFVF